MNNGNILRYNTLTIAFHWITALLFLTLYTAVYYRIWFTVKGDSSRVSAIRIHIFCGVLVGAIVVLRLIWGRIAPAPEFPKQPLIEQIPKKTIQYLLVFFMFFMPLTGYLGAGNPIAPLKWIGIQDFYSTSIYEWLIEGKLGLSWEEFSKPVHVAHHFSGKFIVWVLIAGHSGAALYHYFIRRDSMLQRILPFLKIRG